MEGHVFVPSAESAAMNPALSVFVVREAVVVHEVVSSVFVSCDGTLSIVLLSEFGQMLELAAALDLAGWSWRQHAKSW